MGTLCFDLPSFSVMPLGCYGVSLGGGEHVAHFSLWHVAHPPALSLVPSQPLVGAPQEGTESLGCQSPACALQLAQGQLLLAQHTEVQAELSQWLEEARQAVAAFSPGSITTRCDVFWEQQEVLEVRAGAGVFGWGQGPLCDPHLLPPLSCAGSAGGHC